MEFLGGCSNTAMFSSLLDITVKKMNIKQLINNCSKSYIEKVKAAVGQAYLYRKDTHSLVSSVSPQEVTLKQRPKSSVRTSLAEREHATMLQRALKVHVIFLRWERS